MISAEQNLFVAIYGYHTVLNGERDMSLWMIQYLLRGEGYVTLESELLDVAWSQSTRR